ncbi:glycosyl transferase family 2 [Anaeromyxobacter diazotrophicus]|uniref:Glycosyl transferase family 2 n=2 Tax=Anaeromyxobacter diazotrophicus TaxID=2590199 RepID=A0A7I9VH18_9BACT|nr:glycosyl transferase family 2 [Anaeromyxobacter diazotrophicus]
MTSDGRALTASLVLYRNDSDMVETVLRSLQDACPGVGIAVVDNSPTAALAGVVAGSGATYVHDPTNPGFGASHNRAVKALPRREFHLVVNPDIYFTTEALPALLAFLRQDERIGMVTPRILHPDGEPQYLCKRYPSFLVLFGRRFLPGPLQFLLRRRLDHYEMRDSGYEEVMEVPYASGCFMLFRRAAFDRVEGFDPRFFLYFEDADISLRVGNSGYRVLYYPGAQVFHHWARGSHNSLRLTLTTIRSAFRLFSKHGWKLV